jgi:hypothetical protein
MLEYTLQVMVEACQSGRRKEPSQIVHEVEDCFLRGVESPHYSVYIHSHDSKQEGDASWNREGAR